MHLLNVITWRKANGDGKPEAPHWQSLSWIETDFSITLFQKKIHSDPTEKLVGITSSWSGRGQWAWILATFLVSFCETEDKHFSAGIPFNGLDAEKDQMQFGDGEESSCLSSPICVVWGGKASRWSCQSFAFGPGLKQKQKRVSGK